MISDLLQFYCSIKTLPVLSCNFTVYSSTDLETEITTLDVFCCFDVLFIKCISFTTSRFPHVQGGIQENAKDAIFLPIQHQAPFPITSLQVNDGQIHQSKPLVLHSHGRC